MIDECLLDLDVTLFLLLRVALDFDFGWDFDLDCDFELVLLVLLAWCAFVFLMVFWAPTDTLRFMTSLLYEFEFMSVY
jgi:hypothetical protein